MLIDKLNHFGPGFDFVFCNQFFLQNMKDEVKKVKRLASLDYDWEADNGLEQYKKRKLQRKEREQKRLSLLQNDGGFADVFDDINGRAIDFDDWHEGPGKLARRIYIWWQTDYEWSSL